MNPEQSPVSPLIAQLDAEIKAKQELKEIALAVESGAEWEVHADQWGAERWDSPRHPLKWYVDQGWQVRLKPKPVTRPWSKPEDVPGPVCWIRGRGDYRMQMIIGFAGEVAYITASCGCEPVVCSHQFSETRWGNMEHSTDRINWKPCTTEEVK